jgi:hypothetical protein
MNCDHEGCESEAVCCSHEWISDDGLLVLYWCEDHAPDGAEYF